MMGGRNGIAETADGMKGVTNGLKCERIVNEKGYILNNFRESGIL
jgi:hypothetical protein